MGGPTVYTAGALSKRVARKFTLSNILTIR